MVLSPLELVRYADQTLSLIRFHERAARTRQVWIPPAHWFVAQIRSDGKIAWFMGGVN